MLVCGGVGENMSRFLEGKWEKYYEWTWFGDDWRSFEGVGLLVKWGGRL